MKAEIFSIGTELLMGELTDTNASWMASRLPPLGIQLQWMSIIGDSLDMLSEAFQRGLQRSDIIFTTGGLGPTQDDLTREAVAKALGETPAVQEEVDMICLGGPNAVIECKKLVRRVPQLSREDGFAETEPWSRGLFASAEGVEGMAAFREKRPASWVSRE